MLEPDDIREEVAGGQGLFGVQCIEDLRYPAEMAKLAKLCMSEPPDFESLLTVQCVLLYQPIIRRYHRHPAARHKRCCISNWWIGNPICLLS